MRALANLNIKNVLFIDIETAHRKKILHVESQDYEAWSYKKRDLESMNDIIGSYYNEAALSADFSRIVCISIGVELKNGNFHSTTFENPIESTLISDFFAVLDKMYENSGLKICGHSVKGFDIPFIAKRAIANGIKSHSLIDTTGLKPWELDWIIDTKEIWKNNGYDHNSLVSMCLALDVESPKGGLKGSDVPEHYWNDPENNIKEISEYCERDVKAVYQCVKKILNVCS